MQPGLARCGSGESKLNSFGSAFDGIKETIGQAARRHPHRPRADEGNDNERCGHGLRQPQGLSILIINKRRLRPGLHQGDRALPQTAQQATPSRGLLPFLLALLGHCREQPPPPRCPGLWRGHGLRRLANQHRRPQQGTELDLVLRVTRERLLKKRKAKVISIQLRETLIESAFKSPPHGLSLLSISIIFPIQS